MFCIKEGTCVRNKGPKLANILKTSTPSLSPSAPRRKAGGKHLSCLSLLGMGAWFSCKINQLSLQERGQAGSEQSVEVLHLVLFPVDVSMLYWAEHAAGTGRWNSSGRARDDSGWFFREWVVLTAPGKDREARINHVHPPWQPSSGHSGYACTEIRCGSI